MVKGQVLGYWPGWGLYRGGGRGMGLRKGRKGGVRGIGYERGKGGY